MGRYCFVCETKVDGGITPTTCEKRYYLSNPDRQCDDTDPKIHIIKNEEEASERIVSRDLFTREIYKHNDIFAIIKDEFRRTTGTRSDLIYYFKQVRPGSNIFEQIPDSEYKKWSDCICILFLTACVDCYCHDCWENLFKFDYTLVNEDDDKNLTAGVKTFNTEEDAVMSCIVDVFPDKVNRYRLTPTVIPVCPVCNIPYDPNKYVY